MSHMLMPFAPYRESLRWTPACQLPMSATGVADPHTQKCAEVIFAPDPWSEMVVA
jgi:hypothetical protein